MQFKESTITNYSGLSTETKPTIAAGNTVPNGSRWREVDTGKQFHFDLATDIWYQTNAGWDSSTHVQMNIDYSHHEVHSGSAFAMHVADANLAKDGEINIVFTTPAGAKWFHCEALIGAANAGLFSIEEVAVTTAGTAYVPRNRNRNYAATKASTAITPLVNATYASSTLQLHVEAVGAGRGGQSGGSRGTEEYVLLANTKYCFRYVGANTAVSSGPASIEVTWYEHQDKV
jgi:hypothetical protein